MDRFVQTYFIASTDFKSTSFHCGNGLKISNHLRVTSCSKLAGPLPQNGILPRLKLLVLTVGQVTSGNSRTLLNAPSSFPIMAGSLWLNCLRRFRDQRPSRQRSSRCRQQVRQWMRELRRSDRQHLFVKLNGSRYWQHSNSPVGTGERQQRFLASHRQLCTGAYEIMISKNAAKPSPGPRSQVSRL